MLRKIWLYTLPLLLISMGCEKASDQEDIPVPDDFVVDIPDGDLAFPDALGYGKNTHGGRGGEVYYVTTLEDVDAPGSLRYGLERVQKPRIILFKVSGIIELTKFIGGNVNINIRSPYVTIAGQSAPGDGITIKNGALVVSTHDVIIQHIRIRAGDDPEGSLPDGRDDLDVFNGENVIFDHVSTSWSIDELMSTGGTAKNITIQNCILAEPLNFSLHSEGSHGRGLLILEGTSYLTVVNNLFACNHQRSPFFKGNTRTIDVANNLIYNWGGDDGYATHFSDTERDGIMYDINVYKNYYKRGPDSNEDPLYRGGTFQRIAQGSQIYIDSNYFEDGVVTGFVEDLSTDRILYKDDYSYFLIDEWLRPVNLETIRDSTDIKDYILENAGCRMPTFDIVDQRIITGVQNGTARIIDSPAQVGGYPNHNAGTVKNDTDIDGIPDDWELSAGLDPNNASDAKEYTFSSFYPNLEVYLYQLSLYK